MGGRNVKEDILNGRTALGIEFGSTRIKAVLTDGDNVPAASGSYTWENRYEDHIWTYSLEDIWKGLQESYREMAEDVQRQYGVPLTAIGSIGFSGMMHGYMAFDREGSLLTPFRTWRNSITGEAAEKLTELFRFNIPQRWSIAHLYQAILKEEPHVAEIDFLTTLAGYIHWQLTGEKVVGIGEASGMFPIDSEKKDFDVHMMALFDEAAAAKGFSRKLKSILPRVMTAGEQAEIGRAHV